MDSFSAIILIIMRVHTIDAKFSTFSCNDENCLALYCHWLALFRETWTNTAVVNCAACSYIEHQVSSFQCAVTCDVMPDGGTGINITSLFEQVQDQQKEIRQLKEDVTFPAITYSFSVRQTSSITVDDNAVVYDKIDLNIGGAYSVSTVVPGIYFFSSYAYGGNNGFMYIKQNDQELCKQWISGDNWVHNGCTTVTNLTVGDTVKVTGDSSNPASPYINYDMGFNGHLIQRHW